MIKKIEYKCSICNNIIGTLEYPGMGISLSKFTTKAMPIGIGSGLYMDWICIKCDEEKVRNYIDLSITKRPWMKIIK